MLKALLLLAIGALGAPGPTEPPRAKPATGGWISIDDYPAAAVRSTQEGTVGVKLFVDEAGRVAACSITESSNAPILDTTTCAVLTRRARFVPRAAAPGAQFAGVFTTRVRWVLPLDSDDLCPATLADANKLAAERAVLSSRENDRGTIFRIHAGGGTRLRAPLQKIEATIINGEIYMLDFYLPPKAAAYVERFKRGYPGQHAQCTDSSCSWFEDQAHWHDPGVLSHISLQDMITDASAHLICSYEGYKQ